MKKILYVLAVAVLLGVFCYSGITLLRYYTAGAESQAGYDDLLSMKEQAPPAPTAAPETEPVSPGQIPEAPTVPDHLVGVAHPVTGETVYMLPEFQALFALNPELVGWITVEDTKINYPVVQSGTDNTDYYLTRNFYGKEDSHGCIYAREQCDVQKPSDNITLYGHRMGNGSMFGDLGKFKSRSFWQEHPTIRFDTLQEQGTYAILAVFQTQAGTEESFRYHLFVDAGDPAVFADFIATCKELALFDTGVDAVYGDKLITLSTCDYHRTNGRLVVVAKKIG